MPIPAAARPLAKPKALELFTDRVGEQELLRRVLACRLTTDLDGGWRNLVTVFYGVGGVGKTTLCRRAMQIARHELQPAATCAYVDLDHGDYSPRCGFMKVASHLCEVLARDAGVTPRLTSALLAMSGVASEGGADERWQMVLDAMDKGVELAGVPGLALLVRGAGYLKERAQRRALRQRMEELELWPAEASGRRHLEVEGNLPLAIHHDIMDALEARPDLHLRLLVDGFERIQGLERDNTAQQLLQQFVGSFASPPERADVAGRFRVLIFGRDQVRWDGLYQDPSWNDFWNQHILGGLSRTDAELFLENRQQWHRQRNQAGIAEVIGRRHADILDACDERVAGQQIHYPYFLELAVGMIEADAPRGGSVSLGRSPSELQDRLLRYLDQHEKRALQILALAGSFDETLFDWLAERRLVAFERHSFRSGLHRDQCYFCPIDTRPGTWRFHRHMHEALIQEWRRDESTRAEAAKIIHELLEYHASALRARSLKDWSSNDHEHWRLGSEILITQGLENAFFSVEEWSGIRKNAPWKEDHYLLLNERKCLLERAINQTQKTLGYEHLVTLQLQHALAVAAYRSGDYANAEMLARAAVEAQERILGPDHPDTLKSVGTLGAVLRGKGDLAGAEALYHRALDARERVLGPDHPDTLNSVNNLAVLLNDQGDLAGAEALHRRALDARERILGPDHAETLYSVNNLGSVLRKIGRLAEAEALFSRALDARERVLGPDHPDTITSMSNLGVLLRHKGDIHGAEALSRRAMGAFERILGPSHPNTLSTVKNHGDLLREKGDLAGADKLYRRALEARECVLGPDHPDTVKSREALVACRAKMANQGETGSPPVPAD